MVSAATAGFQDICSQVSVMNGSPLRAKESIEVNRDNSRERGEVSDEIYIGENWSTESRCYVRSGFCRTQSVVERVRERSTEYCRVNGRLLAARNRTRYEETFVTNFTTYQTATGLIAFQRE